MEMAARRRWGAAAAAVALAAAALPSWAGIPGAIDPVLLRRVEREDAQRVRRVLGLFGAGVGYPTRLSASAAALFYSMPASYDCRNLCRFDGLLLRAEPGLRGGRIGVGYARVYGGTDGHPRRLRRAHLGIAVEGSLLRTWGGAPLTPSAQSFAGVSAQVAIVGVHFRAGLYRQVSGGATREPWLWTAGLGWGF